eukprot:COSAG06_NODE_7859_length_2351_cov_0.962700_1_plen_423_part_01
MRPDDSPSSHQLRVLAQRRPILTTPVRSAHAEMTFAQLAPLYIVTGVFQSGGWPSNVAVMGVWFGKSTRGLVMGAWNAHAAIGNILGCAIAAAMFTKSHYGYVQMQHNLSITDAVLVDSKNLTLHDAQMYCDQISKCVVFYTDALDFNGTNGTAVHFDFLRFDRDTWGDYVASGVSSTASATCAENLPCIFQKDVPYDRSYYMLGAIIAVGGVIILLFLTPHPRDVGLPSPEEMKRKASAARDPEARLNESRLLGGEVTVVDSGESVSPIRALCIPGVVEFAACFFFAKFVAYTFLFLLPFYLEAIGLGKARIGGLSTIFDVGGIVGGILCGLISDKLGKRAIVAAVSMSLAIPAMIIYRSVLTGPAISDNVNGGLMFVVGSCINGVYTLITTAVPPDLGTSPDLKGNSNAIAMVTAIIDGTG